jgi:hypothetical protein
MMCMLCCIGWPCCRRCCSCHRLGHPCPSCSSCHHMRLRVIQPRVYCGGPSQADSPLCLPQSWEQVRSQLQLPRSSSRAPLWQCLIPELQEAQLAAVLLHAAICPARACILIHCSLSTSIVLFQFSHGQPPTAKYLSRLKSALIVLLT